MYSKGLGASCDVWQGQTTTCQNLRHVSKRTEGDLQRNMLQLRLVNGALYYYTFVSGLSGSDRSLYITVTGAFHLSLET